MRRWLCLILTLITAASANAIHYEWRFVESLGPVAPNDKRWTAFNEPILIGGTYGPDALICRSYTTETVTTMEWVTNEYRQRIQIPINRLITNWNDIFVLTNYPEARNKRPRQGLHTGFEAMRMWDVEASLPIDSPILTLPRIQLYFTNSLPGSVSLTAALYDYGVPCLPPAGAAPAQDKRKAPDTGNGEYGKGLDYLAKKEVEEAIRWFVKAHEKGHVGAREQLRTNADPTFVIWRSTNYKKIQPQAVVTNAPVSLTTNQDEPPTQTAPIESPPATNTPPTGALPASSDAAALAQIKESLAAMQGRLAAMEEQLRKPRAPEAPPKSSLFSARWLWVVGILVVISALWMFNTLRERAD
jgi:hypothetical protein